MSDITLKLSERKLSGKQLRKLRADGFVPSVVYGGKSDPLSTQSAVIETTKVARDAGRHTPVHLTIDGKKKLAIIKNIDIDPVKHQLRHIAFHTIKQNEKIVTEVSIVLTGLGESAAEREGLIVLQALEKVEVRALPANLPESLEISIVDLATTDDKLTLADVKLPEGVELADAEQDTSLVIANVYEPSALQSANESAGGDATDEAEVESENGAVEESAEGEGSKEEPTESDESK